MAGYFGPVESPLRKKFFTSVDSNVGTPGPSAADLYNLRVSPEADFRRGLTSSMANIQAGKYLYDATTAQIEGNIEHEALLREQARQEQERAAVAEPRVSSASQVHGVGDALDFTQNAAGQVVGSAGPILAKALGGRVAGTVLGGAIAGPPGAAIGGQVGQYGAALYEGFRMNAGEAASQQQADPAIASLPAEQLRAEQIRYGVPASILDIAMPTFLGGRLTNSFTKGFVKRNAARAYKRTGAAAMEMVTESGTEGGQAYLGQRSLDRLNPVRDRSGDAQEIIDSILVGFLGTGVISTSTTVPGYAVSKFGNRTIETAPDGTIMVNGQAAIPDNVKQAEVADENIQYSRTGEPFKEEYIPEDIAKTAAQSIQILENAAQHPPLLVQQAENFLTSKQKEYGVESILDLLQTRTAVEQQADETRRLGAPDAAALQTIDEGGTQLELSGKAKLSEQNQLLPDPQKDILAETELTTKLIELTDPDILKTRKPGQIKRAKKEALELLREHYPEIFNKYKEDSTFGKAPKLGKFRSGGKKFGLAKPKAVNQAVTSLDDIAADEIARLQEEYSSIKPFEYASSKAETITEVDEENPSFFENDESAIFAMANKEGTIEQQELQPVSGEQQTGQRTSVVNDPVAIKVFLQELVKEKRISQRIADTAEQLPLGDYTLKKFANENDTEKTLQLRNSVKAITRDIKRRIEEVDRKLRTEVVADKYDNLRLKNKAHLEAQLDVLNGTKTDRAKLNIYAMILGSAADTVTASKQLEKEARGIIDKSTKATKKSIAARTIALVDKQDKPHLVTTDDLFRIGKDNNPSETGLSREHAIALGISALYSTGRFKGFRDPETGNTFTGAQEAKLEAAIEKHRAAGVKSTTKKLKLIHAKKRSELRKDLVRYKNAMRRSIRLVEKTPKKQTEELKNTFVEKEEEFAAGETEFDDSAHTEKLAYTGSEGGQGQPIAVTEAGKKAEIFGKKAKDEHLFEEQSGTGSRVPVRNKATETRITPEQRLKAIEEIIVRRGLLPLMKRHVRDAVVDFSATTPAAIIKENQAHLAKLKTKMALSFPTVAEIAIADYNEAIAVAEEIYEENLAKRRATLDVKAKVASKHPPITRPTKKIVPVIKPATQLIGFFNRDSVTADAKALYLFTDNIARSSGRNFVDNESWYAKKYGAGKTYPAQTQALIRGLNNAYPISTMINGQRRQWETSQFEAFKKNLDDEIAEIKKALPNFSAGIKHGPGRIGQGSIASLPVKLQEYLDIKLLEIGIKQGKAVPNSTAAVGSTLEAQKPSVKTLNIWSGTGENAFLSNLQPRIVKFGGKVYKSVEHAYQSLKSGKFDAKTYNAYTRSGRRKIPGSLGTNIAITEQLMEDLIRAAFTQNADAATALLATGDATLTHNQDRTIWNKKFPAILMKVRSELQGAQKPTATTQKPLARPSITRPSGTTEQKPLARPSITRPFGATEQKPLARPSITRPFGATPEIRVAVQPKLSPIDPNTPVQVTKIISGGQIGADLAGLQVGKKLGLETGGTAPPGFKISGGSKPQLAIMFGLVEGEADPGIYPKRTMKNVDDADATVAFSYKKSPGTDKTIGYAHSGIWQTGVRATSYDGHRPVLIIDTKNFLEASALLREFLQRTGAKTLNVAGHRNAVGFRPSFNGFIQEVIENAIKPVAAKPTVAKAPGKRLPITRPKKQFSKAGPPNSTQAARLGRNLQKQNKALSFNEKTQKYEVIDRQGKLDLKNTKRVQKTLGNGTIDLSLISALDKAGLKKRKQLVLDHLTKMHGKDFASAVEFMYLKDMFETNAVGKKTYHEGARDVLTGAIQVAIDSLDPLSIAFHESMHTFAATLSESSLGQNLYTRLEKTASSPFMRKQLKSLLEGHPEKQSQLTDVNERIAYMFQFFAASKQAGGPVFKIHNALNLFQKVIQALARITGVITNSYASEKIFESLYSGTFHKAGVNPLEQYKSKELKEVIQETYKSLRGGISKVFSTPVTRVKNMNIPALTKLISTWYADPLEKQGSGTLQLSQQVDRQYRVELNNIILKHDPSESELKRAGNALASMKKPTSALEKDLARLLKKLFAYSQDGDNPVMRFDGIDSKTGLPVWSRMEEEQYAQLGYGYLPRHWDIEAILANKASFKALMLEHGGISGADIDLFIEDIRKSDGAVEQAYRAEFSPFMSSVNKRVFNFIKPSNAHLFVEFQNQDVLNILTRYIRDITHRREHARSFGSEGQITKELLTQARKEGATAEQIEYTVKAIQGLEGRLGTDKVSDLQRTFMVTAMSIVNFAVLPLALFSSLVDPLGVMIRMGSAKAAAATFAAGVRQIVNDTMGKSSGAIQELAEYIGAIENDMAMNIMNNTENGLFMNEKLRKINNFYFKLIGLEQWTRGTRIGALRASLDYLAANKDNSKALDELGLKAGDIELLNNEAGIKVRMGDFKGTDRSGSRAQARRVQNALYRMVDESILRPTAGTRPLWMSDQRFLLLGHLKQFTFTFHNTIIKQLTTRMKQAHADGSNWATSALVFLPLLSYVPMMMAADILRDMATGDWDDDDDQKSFVDRVGRSLQRSAILGNSTFLLDIDDDMAFGGLPINTLLGPVAEKSFALGKGILDPDASFTKAATNLLPASSLWGKWMRNSE